jgi:phosphohistidine phosphatase
VILYVLRHGKAGQPRSHDDDARDLTDRGVAALRAAAPIWRKLDVRPEVVISSPLARALHTAELFVEGMELADPPVTDDRLRPGARWRDLAEVVAEHPGRERIMLVGHEPDLSSVVEELTGATAVRLRKAGLAAVEFDAEPQPGSGELAWLIDPDLYAADD